MIKIGFYSHNIDYAGTWRAHENLLRAMDPERFDVYVLYCPTEPHNRLAAVVQALGPEKLIPFERTHERYGAAEGYRPLRDNFHEVAVAQKFDIIHVSRSGFYEWPFVSRMAPLQIETNMFGSRDDSKFLDRSVAPTHWVSARRMSDAVVHLPISEPVRLGPDLRNMLRIPQDAIVCGRCGRPDNFTPIALNAFFQVSTNVLNLWYVNIGACANFRRFAQGHSRIVSLPPVTDDRAVAAFYRTLDLFLHYRIDGESQGLAICEAMSYGLPVLSHCCTIRGGYNGQFETIGAGGIVANEGLDYTKCLYNLVTNASFRIRTGLNALERSKCFSAKLAAAKMSELYEHWFYGHRLLANNPTIA